MEIVRVLKVDKEYDVFSEQDVLTVILEVKNFDTPRIEIEFEINGVDFIWSPIYQAFVYYRLDPTFYDETANMIKTYLEENNILAMYPYISEDI